jgi:hypothetical protein
MDVRIDETGRHPATIAINDSIELAAILPRQYIRCKADIRDAIVNYRDGGVSEDRVSSIHRQREFEVLDESPHGDRRRPGRDSAAMRDANPLANLDEVIGVRDIGK